MQDMQWVVARLLTEPAYRQEFFAGDEADHAAHGLPLEEFCILRRIDPNRLTIASEGYTGKRFEHVETVFPRTLATLEAVRPTARRDYLERTPFPSDDAEEERTFVSYVEDHGGLSPHLGRFLRDLAAIEVRLHALPRPPGLPSHRLADTLRPVRSPHAFTAQTEGPLHRVALSMPPTLPPAYAADPQHVIVHRQGDDVRVAVLDEDARRLLAACDGTTDLGVLATRFGASARVGVLAWLEQGVLEDAAPAGRG